jgi:hypothetical protein
LGNYQGFDGFDGIPGQMRPIGVDFRCPGSRLGTIRRFEGWRLNARGRKRLLLLEAVSGRKTRFPTVRSPFSMKKGFIQGLDIMWNGQKQL